MKKFLFIISIILLISCNKQHVYQTFYGPIDTDTLKVGMVDDNGLPCYELFVIERDSFIWDGVVKYLPSPSAILYNPQTNKYYKTSPDNQGRTTVSDYNPETKNLDWLNDK